MRSGDQASQRRQPALQLSRLLQTIRANQFEQLDAVVGYHAREGHDATGRAAQQARIKGRGRANQKNEVVRCRIDQGRDVSNVATRLLHTDDVGVFGQSGDDVP